jgi:hypothetical protein
LLLPKRQMKVQAWKIGNVITDDCLPKAPVFY